MKARLVNVLLCTFWLLVIGATFLSLGHYQNTSGASGEIPVRWPSETPISLDSDRNTLLFFAHPACPCTRASVEELNRIMAKARGQLAVHVLFFSPVPIPSNWSEGELRSTVAAIPGVTIHSDINGEQARRFGAETSGQVLLYNPSGKLLFQGGITGSRGHAGENAGSAGVLASLEATASPAKQRPVFGCSLTDSCSGPLTDSLP